MPADAPDANTISRDSRHVRLSARVLPVLAGLAVAGPRTPAAPPPQPRGPAARALDWPAVLRLRDAKDYFTLRERVEREAMSRALPARFARALVQHAFNMPAASNATVAGLLAERALPDALATALRRVQVANHLRLFAYASGLAATDTLLADTARLDSAVLRDLRNTRRIFSALAAVTPQTVVMNGFRSKYVDDTGIDAPWLTEPNVHVICHPARFPPSIQSARRTSRAPAGRARRATSHVRVRWPTSSLPRGSTTGITCCGSNGSVEKRLTRRHSGRGYRIVQSVPNRSLSCA